MIVLILSIAVCKFKASNNYIFVSGEELKILNVITGSIFCGFMALFIIKSGCEGWERGSEIYMDSLSPAIIPLFSSMVLAIISVINKAD